MLVLPADDFLVVLWDEASLTVRTFQESLRRIAVYRNIAAGALWALDRGRVCRINPLCSRSSRGGDKIRN